MSEQTTEPAVEQTTQPEATVATQEAATVDYASLINSDGTFKDEFYTSLPDDLGNHSSVKQMKNVVDLAKSYMNTKGLVGKKLEEFWKSDDAAIVAKRNEIMGIPNSADGYEIDMPEVPEGVAYNEAVLNEFKAKAAELGIPAETAKALVAWDLERATKASEGIKEIMDTQVAEASAALKKEWGREYDYKLSKAQQATDYLGITETVNELGLGRNASFLKMVIDKLVPAIDNDKMVESNQKETLATVSDALNELETKMFKYQGSQNEPEYKALMKEREELLKKLSA